MDIPVAISDYGRTFSIIQSRGPLEIQVGLDQRTFHPNPSGRHAVMLMSCRSLADSAYAAQTVKSGEAAGGTAGWGIFQPPHRQYST
jgi:hypothetical protein